MYYMVIRPFKNIDGSFLNIGDKIECDTVRALVLRRNGLIGNIAEDKPKETPENKQPKIETAIKKTGKRTYRKKENNE